MEVDGISQDPVVETPSVDTPPVGGESQAVETPSGNSTPSEGEGHPAWAPIREALGDVLFHKIRPNLQEFDSEAQKRITELNSKYEPWKSFEAEQVTPDVVKRALGIVRGIDANPLQMYRALEQHLRAQGLLQEPQVQKPEEELDPNADPVDPRDEALEELRRQQEQIQSFLLEQQRQAQQAEFERQADAALTAEIEALRQARPGMTKEEEGLLVGRLALHVRAGDYDKTLADIAAEFDAEKNRILQTPRPNDFAPRIAGAGGAAPTGVPQTKKPEEFTREESQAYLADLLIRGQQQS